MTKDESKFMKTKALHYWSFNMPAKYKVGTIKAKRIPVRFEGQTYGEFKRKAGNTKTRYTKTGNKKVRDPVNYLVKKGVPKLQAQRFLAQPAVIDLTWKEDTSGPYISSHALDSIAYGWKHERKEFTGVIKESAKLGKIIHKAVKEDRKTPTKDKNLQEVEKALGHPGKLSTLSDKEIKDLIRKFPKKYQKKLFRTQRIMKVIKK